MFSQCPNSSNFWSHCKHFSPFVRGSSEQRWIESFTITWDACANEQWSIIWSLTHCPVQSVRRHTIHLRRTSSLSWTVIGHPSFCRIFNPYLKLLSLVHSKPENISLISFWSWACTTNPQLSFVQVQGTTTSQTSARSSKQQVKCSLGEISRIACSTTILSLVSVCLWNQHQISQWYIHDGGKLTIWIAHLLHHSNHTILAVRVNDMVNPKWNSLVQDLSLFNATPNWQNWSLFNLLLHFGTNIGNGSAKRTNILHWSSGSCQQFGFKKVKVLGRNLTN